jgi:acyl-CoA reductase-like NAD-dependent aldehyde dehydrogenase
MVRPAICAPAVLAQRASGLGRELGPEGLSAYLEWKSVHLRS